MPFIDPLAHSLDLRSYLERFSGFFARKKAIALQGDVVQHHRFIQAMQKVRDIPHPPELPNLDEAIKRLKVHGVLSLEELFAFVQLIGYLKRLKAQRYDAPLGTWLDEIVVPQELEGMQTLFTDEGEINPEEDEELRAIRFALEGVRKERSLQLKKLTAQAKIQPYLVDTQIHFYGGEETLLMRGGFGGVLRATVAGRTQGGFFYVIPKAVQDLKEKEAALLSKEEEIIWRYRKHLSQLCTKWVRFLEYADGCFERFDHYRARVEFARANDYVFVVPTQEKKVLLKDFRHPALKDPVAINVTFEKSILLITGVNAGGKTMLLKSILSAVYLAKSLLPFKCDAKKCEIGGFKHIEAIIEDPQSVAHDISTFAGRVQRFAELFSLRDALVGVDEIELGTDADEAAALFRVLLEKLADERGLVFVVTTHHKRLASLMATHKNVMLLAALYDEERRRPTYRFLEGVIGKSYAFETALRYGIAKEIVNEAKRLYGEDKERLNELIERSTILERELQERNEEVRKEREALKAQTLKLRAQRDALHSAYEKKIAELETGYRQAQRKALDALKAKESQEGRRLLNEAHRYKPNIKPPQEPQESKVSFKKGDHVRYRSKEGVILSLKADEAMIDLDGFKVRVPLVELKPVTENTKVSERPRMKKGAIGVKKPSASLSIKLLGMRADEAQEALDRFLSDALLQGFEEVEVIHGIGSGILAKTVKTLLSRHPKVKRFYHPKGNFGATIVEL